MAHQRVGDELRGHRRAHRPADDAAREQVDDRRNVEPAFRRPDVGEVCDPSTVGRGSSEGAIEHVRSDGGGLPLTDVRRQPTPARACFKPVLSHQSLDPMQPAVHAVRQQVVPHAPGAIGSVAADEARPHLGRERLIGSAALARRALEPRIEPATRDTERPAYPIRRPDSAGASR